MDAKIRIPYSGLLKVIHSRKMKEQDLLHLFSVSQDMAVFEDFNQIQKLSERIHIPTSVIVGAAEKSDMPSGVKICRYKDGYEQVSYRDGIKYYTYHHLVTSAEEPDLMALHLLVHSTDLANYKLNGGHASKEFVYVLKGRVRMHWQHEDRLYENDLEQGDSTFIRPGISHSFVAIEENSELIAVNYL